MIFFIVLFSNIFKIIPTLSFSHETGNVEASFNTRENVNTSTWRAPARFNVAAAAVTVAPVVKTSSINKIERPFRYF